nr:hypothetical protein [Mycobacterium szulgai]
MHDPEGPDVDHSDDPADVTDPNEAQPRSGVDPGAAATVSEADAQDEVARAEARAEAARARLERLREAAETGSQTGKADDDDASRDGEQRRAKLTRPRLVRLGLPRVRGGSNAQDGEQSPPASASCSSSLPSARAVTWCGSTEPPCTNGSSPLSSAPQPGKASRC